MAIGIQDNTYLTNRYWQSGIDDAYLGKALEKLSSNQKIDHSEEETQSAKNNRNIDDELLRVELKNIQRKIEETSSMLQTAENNLDNIYSKLVTLKDLANQSAEITTNDRTGIQSEANALVQQIDEIAQNTKYKDQYLINGDLSNGTSTGIEDQSGSEISIVLQSAGSAFLGLTSGTASLNVIMNRGIGDMSTRGGAQKALQVIENSIQDVMILKGAVETYQSLLSYELLNIPFNTKSGIQTKSIISDSEQARQTTSYTKNRILTNADKAILAHGNISPLSVLSLVE